VNVRVRLGTRGSALARWQADWVAARLHQFGAEVELVLITTKGDITQDSLSTVGGQGLFTKEIQRALLDQRVDIAVHSLKDLPTEPVPGLTLAAVPPRESPHDVMVRLEAGDLNTLPTGARIGTGSRRRQSQLLHVRPDLKIGDIRGNVDTRLRRLDQGDFDAIVLAEAGLIRLGLSHRIAQVIPATIMLPAVGQGALGIETRSDDPMSRTIVERLNDAATRASVLAERAMLAGLQGGCLAPVGAWGRIEGSALRLSGVVLSLDGRSRLAVARSGSPVDAERLGQEAANELLKLGAGELIADSRSG
jgi:hydroxymethylbilane synthase